MKPLPFIISCFIKIQNGSAILCRLTKVVLEKEAILGVVVPVTHITTSGHWRDLKALLTTRKHCRQSFLDSPTDSWGKGCKVCHSLQYRWTENCMPCTAVCWPHDGVWLCCITVSHHFGFGMMDAAAMVELAMNWTQLPDQHRCQVNSPAPPKYWMFLFNSCL